MAQATRVMMHTRVKRSGTNTWVSTVTLSCNSLHNHLWEVPPEATGNDVNVSFPQIGRPGTT